MGERHDAVALAGHLWRTPAAFRMYLRGLSMTRLAAIGERRDELPEGHREALRDEECYRGASRENILGRWWMRDGAVSL